MYESVFRGYSLESLFTLKTLESLFALKSILSLVASFRTFRRCAFPFRNLRFRFGNLRFETYVSRRSIPPTIGQLLWFLAFRATSPAFRLF